MITSVTTTAEERRDRVRQLASITTASYNDDTLDVKIDAADSIALVLFGGATTDPVRLENLITVSNIKAASLILLGVGGDSSLPIVTEYRKMTESMVAASNGAIQAQHKPSVRVTSGSTPNGRGFGQ